MEQFFKSVKSAVKNWWVSLILGLLYIGLAIWMFIEPVEWYATLALAFGVIILISGVMEIFFSVTNRDVLDGWGWYLTGGILDFIIGLILVANPGLSMLVIPFLFGFWLMFRGIMSIGTSFDLKSYRIKGWGWTLAAGIMSIILSVFIILNPMIGGISVLILTGLALLFIGIFRIILSIYLHKLHKIGKDIYE